MDPHVVEELFWWMNEVLKGYSDQELEELVDDMWVAEAMSFLMFEWLEWERIKGLKGELDEMSAWNGLSDKVNDFINLWRAKLVFDTGVSMQVAENDRAGVNLDIVMSQFDLWFSRDDKEAFLEGIKWVFSKLDNDLSGDFFVRTPEEYLKLLVYYLGLKKLSDLEDILKTFDANKHNISSSWNVTSFGNRYYFSYFRDALRAPTEFFCALNQTRLEYILETFNVRTAKDFNLLFSETHFMYFLLVTIDLNLLDYLWEENDIDNVSSLISMMSDEGDRKTLLDISNYGNTYVHNMVILLKYFEESRVSELKFYSSGVSFFKKVKPKNLEVLLRVFNPESFGQLQSHVLNDHIKDTIENSDYFVLMEMLEWLWRDIDMRVVSQIISKKYNSSISSKVEQLQKLLLELWESKGNIHDYIYHMFQTANDIEWSIDELIRLLNRLWESMQQWACKNIDFSRLNGLSDIMWGTITSYLAHEVLYSSNIDALYQGWEQVLESFPKGSFDASNELHINLEYKNFRTLSGNEKISKYMKEKFNFEWYASIFKRDAVKRNFGEIDRFELECVAYEAWLLKEYIFQVNEQAKFLWKRVLVIPNLSYGYLPVTAIIDDLEWDDNIDVLMWVKVWSTESHSNREVLSAGLLKWNRGKIMNNQPIIIVVDGTSHLVARDGVWKGARYPDAYQWYLNQVIAMNHANGMDNKDEVNYSKNGKDSTDIERLFQSEEFQRLSEIYKWVSDSRGKNYDFRLWNTAWKDLIIRWWREELSTIGNFSAEDIVWPTMIFCNVGVLDEQLPDDIRRKDIKHSPAYFDDSGRIIDFEYNFDNTWVKAVNSIEVVLREITGASRNMVSESVSTIIKYNQSYDISK